VYVANWASSSVSVIKDTLVGIEEGLPRAAPRHADGPTIIRGVLVLGDPGQKTGDRAELLDVTGRRVLKLRPGVNDVGTLAPGVYFVTERGTRNTACVRKVIVQN